MERKAQEVAYAIRYHQRITDDLEPIPPHEVESIVNHVKHILSQYPYLAGEHVKGKNSKLRRIKHASYRIVFTVTAREVWILGIESRKQVYRPENIETLIRIALKIHGR